ncbi:MAG: hypothetical protein AAGF11_54985 [Myxococcota bacterium]
MGGSVVTVGPGQMESNLTDALAAVGNEGTIVVYEGSYDETLIVNANATVAFLINADDDVVWEGAGAPQLRVTDGAVVLMDGLELRGNDSLSDPAVRVDVASLWVDRSVFAQNFGGSLTAEFNANVVLRNSFLGGVNNRPSVNVETGAMVSAQYVTVGGGALTATAVTCDAMSSMSVSDSILVSQSMTDIDCGNFTANNTATNTMQIGDNNQELGATNPAWFDSYDAADFHLSDMGQATIMEIAQWNEGDPLDDPFVDIDGMLRAGVEGAMEYPGADLP